MSESIDPQHFRHVLGHFPTGAAAVTSCDETGAPVGMIVGSFTSVSLSPPLVAFLPGKESTTSPKILRNGRFCVNVLEAHQESVSRSFAVAGERKFEGLDWTLSADGLPRAPTRPRGSGWRPAPGWVVRVGAPTRVTRPSPHTGRTLFQ